MRQITVRLDEETIAELEAEADERGVSRSERIREVIDSRGEGDDLRDEYEARIADLEAEVDRVEAERDDLRRQLAEANQRIDAANEIVAYAREERSAEQRRREAGVLTRAKWWLVGQGGDDDQGRG